MQIIARTKVFHTIARSDFFRSAYAACRHVPLLGSCLHSLVYHALPDGTRVWIQVPQGRGKGLWFWPDPRFELDYLNGDCEPWVQELLHDSLRLGDCFYDVGAHTGFFSLIAAKFVGVQGTVLAFEPDPEIAAISKANARRNQMRQLKVIEAAVWSFSGDKRSIGASNGTTQGQTRKRISKSGGRLVT